jgi:serine/threonine protein kinase
MSLVSGTRLGSYEILSALGAGGMGEVYRARDTRLKRDVAIKVLPRAFAQDPDRLARFQREAEVLATLNHPNIAHVYGLDRQERREGQEGRAFTFIAMELVEGETLADRLAGRRAKGSGLEIDEALAIARQIADALEAAHDKGVIHRDLKPANVMVTGDGHVKVLDFGLAKQAAGLAGRAGKAGAAGRDVAQGFSPAVSESPTLTTPAMMTGVGVILGTAGYMSPEQAKGRAADKRSDVWAFGCVLFEMLTGTRAFAGADVSDTLAAILRGEPDWRTLPANLPAPILKLLRRCLTKDRKDRLADLADTRLEIVDALATPGSDGTVSAARSRRRSPAFVAVTSAVVTSVIVGLAVWTLARNSRDVSTPSVMRFAIHDTDRVIVSRRQGDLALSPDGRSLAFVGFGEGGQRIWVRALDAMDARSLPGTEGAAGLCWSPDGRSLAFAADGRIRKVAISGGRPQVVSATRSFGTGTSSMTWGSEGTILFIDSRGFWRVPADGGAPTIVSARSSNERSPAVAFLPDGRHFLIAIPSPDAAKAGTFVAALDGGAATRVLAFPAPAQYVAGRLLFVRERVLYAQAFDLSRLQLTGEPVTLADNVSATFGASANGVATFESGSSLALTNDGTELLWKDRSGQVLGQVDQSAGAGNPRLSPDGRRVAMTLRGDAWVLDLATGVRSRVTSGGANSENWTPDGQRLISHRPGFRNGKDVIFETPVGSAGTETLLREPSGQHAHPTDVSADGQYLIYEGEEDGTDLWLLRLRGDRKASALVQTPNWEGQGRLSPDVRWLAYSSDTSGRIEIYVQSFPESGPRIQVSSNGGGTARWRHDGKELFYLTLDGTVMAAPVRSAQPLEFGAPVALFKFYSPVTGGAPAASYDVTPDGQRFLVSAIVRQPDPSLYVLLNWPSLAAPPKP